MNRRAAAAALAGVLVLTVAVVFLQRRGHQTWPSDAAGLIGRLQEVVASGPGPGDPMADPSRADRGKIARAISEFAEGRSPRAPQGFDIAETADGRVTILVERARDGRRRGLGAYLVRPSGADLVIQVPHPRTDLRTLELGVELFMATDARALLVAGADRAAGGGAGDVAHRRDTVFTAVSGRLLRQANRVIQVHGFDGAARSLDYGDAVVSSTASHPDELTLAVAAELRRTGAAVCVYDGRRCGALAGTENVQARGARERDVPFVHVELSAPLRADRRAATVEALARALRAQR